MYNQLLLDIQNRKPGSFEVLLEDPWFSDLLTNYSYKYGDGEETRMTVVTEMWFCITDYYKPREDGDDEYAKKFLKNRLFYKIKDIKISAAKFSKRHTELNEAIEPGTEMEAIALETKIRMSSLPALEKVALVLRFCYDWKVEEIAELLNKSASFVQGLLRSGLNGEPLGCDS